MDVMISVIIPFYNLDVKILSQCVDSILQQNFEDFEIIIVNDGSYEEYTKKLDIITAMDQRIKIIYQNNQGVSVARNKGCEVAKGKYVIFVDADDIVLPTFFSDAYAFAEEKKADFVVGAVLHTDYRDSIIINDFNDQYEVWDAEKYKNILTESVYKIGDDIFISRGPYARLIRKEILNEVLFPEKIKVGEDLLWNINIAEKCKTIYIIHKVWYIYWKNPNSVLNKYNPEIVSDCEEGLELLAPKFNLDDSKECKAYCNRIYYLLHKCVFKCYLGNKHCNISYIKRWANFCSIINKSPWNSVQNKYFFKIANFRERIKILLTKFRILFVFYTVKDNAFKFKKHKRIKTNLSNDQIV